MTFFVLCLFSWEMNHFSVLINAGWSLEEREREREKKLMWSINQVLSWVLCLYKQRAKYGWEFSWNSILWFFARTLDDLMVLWKWDLARFSFLWHNSPAWDCSFPVLGWGSCACYLMPTVLGLVGFFSISCSVTGCHFGWRLSCSRLAFSSPWCKNVSTAS